MKKILIAFALLLTYAGSATAQSDFCKLYGTFQGAMWPVIEKQCSEHSNDEACSDFYDALGNALNLKLSSHDDFVKQQAEGCEFLIQEVDGQIHFWVDATSKKANETIESFWDCWKGRSCDSPAFELLFQSADND